MAAAAGVSKSAVSFALNDRPGLNEETRRRILAVAADLGWTPSVRGRALSVSRSMAVGMVLARSAETLRTDPFFSMFIAGVEMTLAANGYALVLQVAPRGVSETESYRRIAQGGRVDGVFLTDLRKGDPRPALLHELALPAVLVASRGGGVWPSVTIDDGPGIAAAVAYLLDLGHTNIGFVGGPDHYVHSTSRRLAWECALQEAGSPRGPFVASDFSAQGGADATKILLDSAVPPTAVVYANDLMAIAGMSLALGRGMDVPGQLSITGFDDIEIAAYLRPALTTVRTDVTGWGEAAAAALLEMIAGRHPGDRQLSPPQLIVRGSTGPPTRFTTPLLQTEK